LIRYGLPAKEESAPASGGFVSKARPRVFGTEAQFNPDLAVAFQVCPHYEGFMAESADPGRERKDLEALLGAIEQSPLATVITNPRLPDNPIVEANRAFTELTGYERDEVVGRNCRFLAGERTDQEGRRILREAVNDARPVLAELVNYRKDGSPFRNAVMIAPLLDEEGKPVFFVGTQMETSAPQAGERQRQARARVAQLSPRQRQVLERMVGGLRNKQIAADLGIEEATVKMHRGALIARLEAATSAEAVRIGVEAGLGC
jgi:PAS domain S-box-containing protein